MPDGSIPAPAPAFIPAPVIVASVAATIGTTVNDMMSKRLASGLNAARQIAALLFADFTLLSMVEMGPALGRANETGGRHLLLGARERLGKDERFRVAYHLARVRLVEGL